MKSLLEEKIQNGPLLSVFLFAKTQTHTTHTLSTPAVAEYLPASQFMQTDEPVVRAQRQITSQIHMHMYICIEDVCVCVPIFIMYVCIIRMNECMHVYTHTHNDL